MSHCRGKTRFELFKKGLARNDMIKEIQKCDRQMNRMFDRFLVSIPLYNYAHSHLNPSGRHGPGHPIPTVRFRETSVYTDTTAYADARPISEHRGTPAVNVSQA